MFICIGKDLGKDLDKHYLINSTSTEIQVKTGRQRSLEQHLQPGDYPHNISNPSEAQQEGNGSHSGMGNLGLRLHDGRPPKGYLCPHVGQISGKRGIANGGHRLMQGNVSLLRGHKTSN